MAFADAKVNYDFTESFLGQNQKLVTNNEGRTVLHLELVWLDGYFGEVREFANIANGATGMININAQRHIYTDQIAVGDTFVLGGVVYFLPGGAAAAGQLRAGAVDDDAVPVGICTKINAGVAVEFMPFVQKVGGGATINATTYALVADATTQLQIPDIPVGARIIDVLVEARATVGGGTVQLRTVTPAAITDAIVCAVDTTLTRCGTIDDSLAMVIATGLFVVSANAGDRALITIYWR